MSSGQLKSQAGNKARSWLPVACPPSQVSVQQDPVALSKHTYQSMLKPPQGSTDSADACNDTFVGVS